MSRRYAPEDLDASLEGTLFDPIRALDAEMQHASRVGAIRAAEQRCDEGIANAVSHARSVDPEWEGRFLRTVREMALGQEFLMSEDVLERCPPPLRANAKSAGGFMRKARELGYIVAAGFAKARTSNNSHKTKWRSLLYRGAVA